MFFIAFQKLMAKLHYLKCAAQCWAGINKISTHMRIGPTRSRFVGSVSDMTNSQKFWHGWVFVDGSSSRDGIRV